MVCFTKYDPQNYSGLTSDELVFLQPVEYNSYFAGACISWRRDANGGAWQPHYRITDHLGSTRLETSSNGTITAAYDYEPFGEQIPLMTTKTRKTYIGKERDDESYLGDFGVRKYDYAAGRFTSPDMLWEKYMGWSPYNYCMNNPLSARDGSGLALMLTGSAIALDEVNGLVLQSTGGMYGTSVNSTGLTTLVSTGQNGPMSEKEQAFYKYISQVTDPNTPITSVKVSESTSVLIGSYNKGIIDIDDIINLGQGDGINSSSAFIHEMFEQFEKQSKGLSNDRVGYNLAHPVGVSAEDAVSGAKRLDIFGRQPTSTLNDKTGTGTLDLNYMINNSKKTISIELNSNNVIGVKR